MYTKEELRRLRNAIPVATLITEDLNIPWKLREGHLRFLCPNCKEFYTGINPRVNLARCFRCLENYNPIDLVMADKKISFLKAVSYLETLPKSDPVPGESDS